MASSGSASFLPWQNAMWATALFTSATGEATAKARKGTARDKCHRFPHACDCLGGGLREREAFSFVSLRPLPLLSALSTQPGLCGRTAM